MDVAAAFDTGHEALCGLVGSELDGRLWHDLDDIKAVSCLILVRDHAVLGSAVCM